MLPNYMAVVFMIITGLEISNFTVTIVGSILSRLRKPILKVDSARKVIASFYSQSPILRVKKLKRDILTHVPQDNTLLKLLIIITKTDVSHSCPSRSSVFSKICLLPQQKGEGEETIKML